MPRSIWSGSISFGLVNIPVKVYNAVTEKQVRFHLLHDKDHSRIRLKRVCIADGEEVPSENLVKGYEIAPDQYVTVTDEELEALDPEATRTVDILDFVDLEQIDPVFFDRSYYLMPDARASKPYALLQAAMLKAKKVGVARVVMRDKEYLVALRPLADGLVMETMHYADEVHPASEVLQGVAQHAQTVDARELTMAQTLIKTLSSEFDPAKYKSEHETRLHDLLEKKAAGEKIHVAPKAKPETRAVDLLAQLEKSVQLAKERIHSEA